MRRLFAAGAAMLAAAFAPPVMAAPDADLARLQARDQQLFATGWRLTTGNAAFCAGQAPALGLALLDAGAFATPAEVRAQLALSGDIAVGAVAPDSPAARAGIAVNDTLLAIGDVSLGERFPRADPAWQRLISVTAALDAAAAAGPVTLTLARGTAAPRRVTLTGVAACPTRFEVLDSGKRAVADGKRVIFGRDFVAFGYAPDEFAAVVAHELAHNLLHHRLRLDDAGRSQGRVRLTEREADRLMPWLLANAGYDPDAAAAFMERWGPRHGGWLFRARTHDGWDERAAMIRAESAKVKAAMASEGRADWARHFTRETLD